MQIPQRAVVLTKATTFRGLAAALWLLTGCAGGSSRTITGTPPDTGFHITGDPESSAGATWTYRGRVDAVDYDCRES